jgi:hypothetical protein
LHEILARNVTIPDLVLGAVERGWPESGVPGALARALAAGMFDGK